MSTADVVTLIAFLIAALAGTLLVVLQNRRRQRPQARIRERVTALGQVGNEVHLESQAGAERARAIARERALRNPVTRWWHRTAARVHTLGGRPAWLRLGLAAAAGGAMALLVVAFAGLAWWAGLAVCAALPAALIAWTHAGLVRNFKKRFLQQLPQAIDMIMRASMAGVPATQAIRSAGDDIPAPLGPEFRDIGDSLYLGEDLDAVLRDAMARVDIPEFSFFGVYLMVQRSTGGSMGETLQNLSNVIRSRSELDLKVRAMTAEGRASSLIMAILPFAVFGFMFLVNREYAQLLFSTDSGRTLLFVSLGMIAVGMLLIRRMARLED